MVVNDVKIPHLEEVFRIEGNVLEEMVIGQSDAVGCRKMMLMGEGRLTGKIQGHGMGGGVDSQVVKPDGTVEVSARMAFHLDTGENIYIENNGIRRANDETGEIYFVTTPRIESYSEALKWLMDYKFICYGTRLPDKVIIVYYRVK